MSEHSDVDSSDGSDNENTNQLNINQINVNSDVSASKIVAVQQQVQQQASPAHFKKQIHQEMITQRSLSFSDRSNTVWERILSRRPDLRVRIEQFQKRHADKLEVLQRFSWKALKSNPQILGGKYTGVNMTRKLDEDNLSMEEFRGVANEFIASLVEVAGEEMDLPDISWSASGTPGYNSDVDTAILPKGCDLSIEDACFLKILRDMTHTYVFGGLSGTQLDTESYMPHPAKDETASVLSLRETQAQFHTTEYAMGLLQGKVGMADDEDAGQEMCRSEIESMPASRKEVTTAIIHSIDEWHAVMQADIERQIVFEFSNLSFADIQKLSREEIEQHCAQIQKQNPEAYKRAALNYKYPIMLQLATERSRLDDLLAEKTSLLKKSDQTSLFAEILTVECEELHVKRDIINKMINSLQDEGTFTQSEGNVTLFRAQGQVHARMKDSMRLMFKQMASSTSLDDLSNADETPSHIRKSSLDDPRLNRIRSSLKEQHPSPKDPTAQELTLAAFEEHLQFCHVIHEGLHKAKNEADFGAVAINSGKYALRTIRNKVRAMMQVKAEWERLQKPLPQGFESLLTTMKRHEEIALTLEHSKRKFVLNYEAAGQMLIEEITNVVKSRRGVVDHATAISLFDTIYEIIDRVQNGDLSDDTVLKREKMNAILELLQLRGFLSEEDIAFSSPTEAISDYDVKKTCKNPRINRILQAFVGYSRTKPKHQDLIPIYQEADVRTVKAYNLHERAGVEKFLSRMTSLSHEWQNMAHEMGVVSYEEDPSWVQGNMNFNQIWQKAKHAITA